MFARIGLFSPPYQTLSYSLPDAFPAAFWRPGLRVLAPVGKSLRSGFIIEVMAESGLPAETKCRDVIFPLEREPLIDANLAALFQSLAARQGLAPGAVPGHALPAGLRRPELALSWRGQSFTGRAVAALSAPEYAALASALLDGSAVFSGRRASADDDAICSLAADPPWPLRPAATRQARILDFLYENGSASRGRLLKELGAEMRQPLAKLAESGLVRLGDAESEEPCAKPPSPAQFELNEAQRAAAADLLKALGAGSAQFRLLYGVTGSGKTAVYMEAARACLAAGKACLLLAPEVALARKLLRDVEQALPGAQAFLYHGCQPPGRRERLFRAIAAAPAPYIVVGTRSALFLPLRQPGLIILDEEHDASYKQDENLPYHAKELAWLRAQQAAGLLVLGSATPDARSFHAARQGALPMLRLPKRAGGGSLPPIELVKIDVAADVAPQAGAHGLLGPECEAALGDCLKKGEQAVILLNRRGYAPLIYCLGCGQTLKCPHCQIGMAFHKAAARLVCHFCGHSLPWPSACPECGSTNYITIGEGTERIAERLEALAGAPVLRLDRDNARRPGRSDEILAAFGAGASPFLVGTQMISKGHHFPNVTLVVAVDGDIGLNLPDYRAAERSFQLLAQAAGRAGRGAKPGRALIQTRKPDYYCWEHIKRCDYEGFYEAEIALRRKYCYPPFIKLGLLRLSHPLGDDEGAAAGRQLGMELKRAAARLGVKFLGPAPAPMPILKGRRRIHCLMKAESWQPMRELWLMAQKSKEAKKLRIFLDLDPVNMM